MFWTNVVVHFVFSTAKSNKKKGIWVIRIVRNKLEMIKIKVRELKTNYGVCMANNVGYTDLVEAGVCN